MLTPRHKGRGRWVVVDGDREVAGPFMDKDAAIGWIEQNKDRTAPELGAALAKKTADKQEGDARRADFLATRDYQRELAAGEAAVVERVAGKLLAVLAEEFGEEIAARYINERRCRELARDPKGEAYRRLRLREIEKHGQQPPAMTLERVAAA